jgi:hypothetical protein
MLNRRAIRTRRLPRFSFLLLAGARELSDVVAGTSVVDAEGRKLIRRRPLRSGAEIGGETATMGSIDAGVTGADCVSG